MDKTQDELINELIESTDGDRWTLAATVVQQRATIAALREALERMMNASTYWSASETIEECFYCQERGVNVYHKLTCEWRQAYDTAAQLLSPTPAGQATGVTSGEKGG